MKLRLWIMAIMMSSTLLPSALGQEHQWVDGKWVTVPSPVEGTPEGELAIIRTQVHEGRYAQAVRSAKKFVRKYPHHEGAEEAHSLAGDGEFARRRYFQAFEWSEKQIDAFPTGAYLERAIQREFKVAQAFLEGKKRIILGFLPIPAREDGIEIFNRIIEHAPASELSEQSMMKIADYRFQTRKWDDAIAAYDRYLQSFGRAERAPYAMLQAARACFNSYRGPNYEETPLLEAGQRYRMFAEQFPIRADRENVPATIEHIRQLRAQKCFRTAKFYERVRRPVAARHYYQRVLDDFPDTDHHQDAELAIKRLTGSATDTPDRPADIEENE